MIPLYKPSVCAGTEKSIAEVLKSGWLGYGKKSIELEKQFTQRYEGFALATNSCTSALNIVAKTIIESDLDEVIIPAITFVSTGMAFLEAGFKVVVADVDDNGLLDIDSVIKNITKNTRAIVAVHLYGQKCELHKLRSICDELDIYLVEDSAHRIGFSDSAKMGDFACYSFNVMKEAASGEGGLVWAKDTNHQNKIKAVANVGMNVNTMERVSKNKHLNYQFSDNAGLKFMQNDIIASITLQQLEYLDENIIKRKSIADRYNKILSKNKAFHVFDRKENDSYLMYVVKLEEENISSFRDYLAKHNIATSHHYPSLANHPLFLERFNCKTASSMEHKLVTLPCFVDMTEDELSIIERVMSRYNAG